MLKYMILGNIGRDAETRTTQGGDKVTSFSVAGETGYGDNKKTTWVDCSIWGERGVKICQYLKKGTKVFVMGEAGFRLWDDSHSGEKRRSETCRVETVELCGGRKDGDNQESTSSGRGDAAGRQSQGRRQAEDRPIDDDEIPF